MQNWPIFTKVGETTDTDTVVHPQQFWSDLADIQMQINPEIRTRIPGHFWFRCTTTRKGIWPVSLQVSNGFFGDFWGTTQVELYNSH